MKTILEQCRIHANYNLDHSTQTAIFNKADLAHALHIKFMHMLLLKLV